MVFFRITTLTELCALTLRADPPYILLKIPTSTWYSYRAGERWPRPRPEGVALRNTVSTLLLKTCAALGCSPPDDDPGFRSYVDACFLYEEFLRMLPLRVTSQLQYAATEVLGRLSRLQKSDRTWFVTPDLVMKTLFERLKSPVNAAPLEHLLIVAEWLVDRYIRVLSTMGPDFAVDPPTLQGIRRILDDLKSISEDRPYVPRPWYLDVLMALSSGVGVEVGPRDEETPTLRYASVVKVHGTQVRIDIPAHEKKHRLDYELGWEEEQEEEED
jgi:hypothetical protein